MKAHDPEVKSKVLELLQSNRSLTEISKRTGIVVGTIEDWASGWRRDGTLTAYKREGAAFTQKAKLLSNGYYPSIRKRYHTIKRLDMLEGREFGFNSPVEAIPYFLKDGQPRACTYCGLNPPAGKVWGLDRLNSDLGHAPGNVVPCCGSNSVGNQMSCQASKSRYPLREWMAMSISRALGRPATEQEINARMVQISALEAELARV